MSKKKTYLHNNGTNRIVLIRHAGQGALKNRRRILHINNSKHHFRRIVEPAVKHTQLDLVYLSLAVVKRTAEDYGAAEHVDISVAVSRHDLEVVAEVGSGFIVWGQTLYVQNVSHEVNVLGLKKKNN